MLIGIGAAGNKAVVDAVKRGTVAVEDTVIINSTSKDFPPDYEGQTIILSPIDSGCGKEVEIARQYAMTAIKDGRLVFEDIHKYSTVIICTSVEGGTGSGASPLIAQYIQEVHKRNVHVIAFTGFEEDVRGIQNTITFFKNLNDKLMVQTISNIKFMAEAGNNKFKAEQLANQEMCDRIEILTGKNFIASSQNIDETDIQKISNTPGYMTVEHCYFEKNLIDQTDYNKMVKNMLYNSKSIQSADPGSARFGIILNFNPMSEDAIDFTHKQIISTFGLPFESYTQRQWDGKKEYLALIVSGMNMPVEEIQAAYNRFNEMFSKVNQDNDSFYNKINELEFDSSKFDMIKKDSEPAPSVDEFLSQFH